LKRVVKQRQFDLLKEHRSYCPYVVKSTVVPSLPSFNAAASSANGASGAPGTAAAPLNHPSGPLEGWRAVLAVLLRYGMAQRQRAEHDVLKRVTSGGPAAGTGAAEEAEEEQAELDNVKAMVDGVKQCGGRDLMRYVRGLLS